MSYPPPPGTHGGQSHPSLPARPPPSKSSSSGFKPAVSSGGGGVSSTPSYQTSAAPSYPTAASYAPGAAPPPPGQYGSYPTTYSAAPGAPAVTAGQYQQQSQAYYYGQSSGYNSSGYAPTTGGGAPYGRNPYPSTAAAATAGGDPEADMAAQYAQWQSGYGTRDPNAARDPAATDATNKGAAAAAAAGAGGTNVAADGTVQPDKKKTVVREGGGKKWTDDSLLEWDPSHPRLFVGNLAGEVTDDSLLKAFARWKSVQKARVVRDKRTMKSKNYGFVSFSDPDDYFQAAKEMNGKYIQSHPVTVTRAKTEIRPSAIKEKDHRGKKHHNNNNNQHNNNRKRDSPYESSLGPTPGGGVQKSGHKKKNGLRLLG